MRRTMLVTGFGPVPGAPYNPTGALVRRLVRMRHPALADFALIGHVFPTSYAAVDRDLPKLIARHKPDVLLMFGLARRAKTLRVETRAANGLARLADVGGASPARTVIARGKLPHLAMPTPARALLAAIKNTAAKVELSRDAGRYLCNYLCWQAASAMSPRRGPKLAAFIHVPDISRKPLRRGRRNHTKLTPQALARAGMAAAVVLAGAARRASRA